MFLSTQLNGAGIDPARRLLHLALYVAVALMAAQGRFHTRSMAKGLAFGLLVSAAAYYADYGTSYEGRLAGLMADPNAAGYMLTTLGALALAGLPGSRMRVPLGLLLVVAVVLTYSRTSLLALALIVVWVIIGRKLAVSFGALLLAAMIWVVTNIPVTLQTFGPFEDRIGSDVLRARIVKLEELQISDAPWYGHGPGSSWVEVQGQIFFFHNSYLSIHNEGGRVAQLLIVVVGAAALVALLSLRPELRNPWYEAAIIAVAVCAVNLGEVLLELPAALALGMAAHYVQSIRDPAGRRQSAIAVDPGRPRLGTAAMTPIYVAANRGDIGGGEVMLLRLAAALNELGYDVTAVVPSTPSNLAVQARAAGLAVEVVSCHDRPSYARALRRWDRGRDGVLWCNGLLPALATAGRPRRIVHLHQMPVGLRRPLARVARSGAAATVVPSRYLADRLAPAEVLPNWTDAWSGEPGDGTAATKS